MAQPQQSFIKPPPADKAKPIPYTAWALIQRDGLWVCRTMTIDGDRVVAYTDSSPDIRSGAAGLIVRGMSRP